MKFFTWRQKLGEIECPYLIRWVLDLGLFSIRLHHWISSDDKRNFHDHPWNFVTFVLWGKYIDISPDGKETMKPGMIRFRPALHRHTVSVCPGGCWTLLICGPQIRKWGFWVRGGKKFVKSNKYFLEYGHHPCNQEEVK